MTSLHKVAIKLGAELAPAYEFSGSMQPATYTVTLAQLESIVGKASARLLTALDTWIEAARKRALRATKTAMANPQATSFRPRGMSWLRWWGTLPQPK